MYEIVSSTQEESISSAPILDGDTLYELASPNKPLLQSDNFEVAVKMNKDDSDFSRTNNDKSSNHRTVDKVSFYSSFF